MQSPSSQQQDKQIYSSPNAIFLFDTADTQKESYQDQVSFDFNKLAPHLKTTVRLGTYHPDYQHMVVVPGVSLKGLCTADGCRVKDKEVWIRVGYQNFQMCDQLYESRCPVCKQQIDYRTITTLGYRLTKISIKGIKLLANGKKQKFSMEDEQKEGLFIKFKESCDSSIKWGNMTIIAQKI